MDWFFSVVSATADEAAKTAMEETDTATETATDPRCLHCRPSLPIFSSSLPLSEERVKERMNGHIHAVPGPLCCFSAGSRL